MACVAVFWGVVELWTRGGPESHSEWVILLSPYRQHLGSVRQHCYADAGVIYRDLVGKWRGVQQVWRHGVKWRPEAGELHIQVHGQFVWTCGGLYYVSCRLLYTEGAE